jgi:diacylglycerol kinase (ATP)
VLRTRPSFSGYYFLRKINGNNMEQENKQEVPGVFIVHNPVAGTSDPADVRAEIESHLAGRNYHIYETTGEENVREIVKDAVKQGYRMIWAAGGDGTVAAVANGLVSGDVPLGIVPLGSGNIIAKELDIPLDVTAACDLLVGSHRTRRLDVLEVDKNYYVLAVSVGISAFMMAETAREQKRRLGQMAYLLNGVRIILSKALWPFRVSIDGQPIVVRASEVIAANVGAIGYKPIRWGDQVRPDDGKIDLCRIRVDSTPRLLSVLNGLLFGRQDELEELTCTSASRFIEIESRGRIPVQGDGENIGYTPVRISITPQSLPVIVPVDQE